LYIRYSPVNQFSSRFRLLIKVVLNAVLKNVRHNSKLKKKKKQLSIDKINHNLGNLQIVLY